MVRLFQLELEHYEKIEGAPLSLVGKANRLATMIRQNLRPGPAGLRRGAALRRLGHRDREEGRIFSYDATGGRYEEQAFFSVGSGLGVRPRLTEEALPSMTSPPPRTRPSAVIQALYDASDDDSATGGPDLTRRIYPIVMTATADGVHRVDGTTRSGGIVDQVVAAADVSGPTDRGPR